VARDLPNPGGETGESQLALEQDEIRARAYEISQRPDSGSSEENWLRAEEELRRPAEDEDAVRRDEGAAARDAQHGERLQADLSSLLSMRCDPENPLPESVWKAHT
jgi:hypothetical protein